MRLKTGLGCLQELAEIAWGRCEQLAMPNTAAPRQPDPHGDLKSSTHLVWCAPPLIYAELAIVAQRAFTAVLLFSAVPVSFCHITPFHVDGLIPRCFCISSWLLLVISVCSGNHDLTSSTRASLLFTVVSFPCVCSNSRSVSINTHFLLALPSSFFRQSLPLYAQSLSLFVGVAIPEIVLRMQADSY